MTAIWVVFGHSAIIANNEKWPANVQVSAFINAEVTTKSKGLSLSMESMQSNLMYSPYFTAT